MHYPLPEPTPNDSSSWHTLRRKVFERDAAQCHVCARIVPWADYECSHIVDRVCGGADSLNNLVTMCRTCNRLKPCHDTRAEYVAWLAAGDWRVSIAARLPNGHDLLAIYLGTPESDAAEARLRAKYPESFA